MATLFNTLGIGYSGLSASQVAINTTGHNISNAQTEGYSRQRVITEAATPLNTRLGQVGNGTQINDVKRVFDSFVFNRYTGVAAKKEYSDYEMQTLEELSTYFPEIDGVGIKADLAKYYEMWQTFADNPDNDAIKIALAKQTQTLSEHVRQTQNQVLTLQQNVNDQLALDVNEVNTIAQQIADLNKSIDAAQSGTMYEASDLQDKRNLLEKRLSQLIGAEVNQGQLKANNQLADNYNAKTESYTISVNGFNIVDGMSVHPLKIDASNNASGFYNLSYERQDGTLIPLEEEINGGRIAAELNLRGGTIETTSGLPTDGVLQRTVSSLDAFATGLIESTNNLYAKSATANMHSNVTNLDPATPLLNSNYNIKEGSFSLVVYDLDGNVVAKRAINIDNATTMGGAAGTNSIVGQVQQNIDDNGDNNGANDIDDLLDINYAATSSGDYYLDIAVNGSAKSLGYKFAIEDGLTGNDFASGTNFAGAFGMHRFLDGQNAKDMDLNFSLRDNPSTISAGYTSASGDNRVALDMVQHQFENYDFTVGGKTYNTTTNGMFDVTATYVGVTTNTAIGQNETITTQFNATELEYQSISKVSIDEEMTNLIKYQTSYGAAAKLITTVDQMMQTLLGIKQ